MNEFSIRDLENLSGIKAHTIRIWEQRYSFLKPKRTGTNIRFYTGEELRTLLNISLLNKFGFKISHIDRMNPVEVNERILSLTQAEALQEKIVNDLILFMVHLDMDEFEALLDNCIRRREIDQTIRQIIFPFLERIGILWQTNHINPAQEHLVSNIIRQKILLGIEDAKPKQKTKRQAILFLPEGEYHELGLLYAYYLLKSKGVKVLYLGANLPMKDLDFVFRLKNPDFLYTHLTSPRNFKFETFLQNFKRFMPSASLVLSGKLLQTYKKRLPESVHFKKSLEDLTTFIANL